MEDTRHLKSVRKERMDLLPLTSRRLLEDPRHLEMSGRYKASGNEGKI